MAKKLVLQNNPLLSGPAYTDRERTGVPYKEIALDAIDRDLNQPRVHFDDEKLEELSMSIKRYGVLSPILVRPGNMPGRYVLIAGERRFRASKLAGLSSIPAMIDKESADEDDGRTLAVQLVENIQRDDLTPLERAHAFSALKEANDLSIRGVADKLGIDKNKVHRSLKLLDLPDDLLNALRQGASESKILTLSEVEDERERAIYLKNLDSFTRDEIKEEVRESKSSQSKQAGSSSKKKKVELSPEDERIVDEIQRSLGMKVVMSRVSPDSQRGRLQVEFYSEEDLRELFRKLVAEQ